MPINHTKLDLVDVTVVLRRRGYAFHSQYETGIRLTKPDMGANGVFKETRRRKRILLVPISPAHLDEILVYSRNADEAAEQIEKMSLGVQDAPRFGHAAPAQQPAIDPGAIDQLISNRVANELAKQQAGNDAKLAELQQQLVEAQQQLDAAKAASKPARKKAAKKAARKPARKKTSDGLPELTAEEQAHLDKVMQQESRNAGQ
jgi:hypothetical protein